MQEIIKQLLRDDTLFYIVLILLVGIGSFGLGRLSVEEDTSVTETRVREGRMVETNSSTIIKNRSATSTQRVVVSKNGEKYHALWCAGASQIHEKNKVYYDTPAAARAAGYAPAANCEGLE